MDVSEFSPTDFLSQLFSTLAMRLYENVFMTKLKMARNQLASLHRQNTPKNIYVQHNDLQIGVSSNDINTIKSFKKMPVW